MIDDNTIPTTPYYDLSTESTTHHDFDGYDITVTTAPTGSRIEIRDFLRDPSDFHGPTDVDHVINFGPALSSLIGTYSGSSVFQKDGEQNPDVDVLASTSAKKTVRDIDALARKLIANPGLYDDVDFCQQYYDLAAKGYQLLSESDTTKERGIPVSLIRAGLVTTRLAHGLNTNDKVPNEVQVETKRFHPIDGNHEDISVTVRWSDFGDPTKLNNQAIEIADFVNPASWASTAALLLALKHGHNVQPSSVMHRSFMGTEQGVALAQRTCEAMNILTYFKMVGITGTLNNLYYLSGDVAVGDAGQALRHFRPNNHQ